MKTQQQIDVWTNSDFLEERCSHLDIGQPKPPPETEPEDIAQVLSTMPEATMAEFKQAVLSFARDQCGSYRAFLEKYPGFHQKFLLAMAKEPAPVAQHMTVYVDAPWITPGRLSYKEEPQLELVQEVQEPKPWREGDPEAGRKSCIATDELLPKR